MKHTHMKHIIIAPDSFKGTFSADEICDLEAAVIQRYFPDAVIDRIPMADGGEGLVEAWLKIFGGQRVSVSVTGPLGEPVDAVYGLLPDGSAVMEMAASSGLPLSAGRLDPLHASSRGVGEQILDAAGRGAARILLGLGGSATNDCGIGMAAALGFRFYDAEGAPVEPLTVNLGRIASFSEPDQLPVATVTAVCDVDSPLLGPNGATYTFGPQKGVDDRMLPKLEADMAGYAAVLEKHYGRSPNGPGSGAAGGLGAAVALMLKGTLRPGIDLLLDAVEFDRKLQDADLVFTGEGRIDWQSAHGKAPMGVGMRCKRAGVPCIALCGTAGPGAEALYDCGISAIFSSVKGITTMEEIRKTGREDLTFLTDSVLRMLAIL